jgi:DNA mismatch repair protein MLH3
MDLQPSPIKPLPPESQAQIRSSVVITSLNDVVIGLLENVLDVGATSANVRLDYTKGYCSVTDNGTGIPVADFGLDGHLGSLHCTSKLDATRLTYGRYGRFLYHVSALSLLRITSKRESSVSTITLHRAKVIARSNGRGDIERVEPICEQHGTHVVVANLFGDIPVRYRHIAARLESNTLAETEFSILKKGITALILACGRDIDIKVVDLKTRRTYKHKTDALERRTSFDLPAICSALHQGGYIEHLQDASFRLVSVQTLSIRIRAAISLHPAPAKDVQFVSIGIRPVHTSSSASLFQDEINAVFELSDFGAVEDGIEVSDGEQDRRRKDRRFASDRHTNRQLNGPKMGVDRWPMFYIRIDPHDSGASTGLDDEQSESGLTEKWVEKVLALLRSMFYEFLTVHHFRPRARKRRKLEKMSFYRVALHTTATSPQALLSRAASEPLLAPKHFDTWSRVKTGMTFVKPMQIPSSFNKEDPLHANDLDPPRPQTPAERVQLAQNAVGIMELQALTDEDLELLVQDYDDEQQSDSSAQRPNATETHNKQSDADAAQVFDANEAAYLWTDAITGIEHKINARNGFIIPHMSISNTRRPVATNSAPSQRPTTAPAGTAIAQRIRARPSKKTPLELIASLQQSSLIRSFSPLEAQIPSIIPNDLDISATARNCTHPHRKTSSYFSTPPTNQSHSLHKTDLESARFISQVDSKFILIQTQPINESTPFLVLIDQHAADERVRVEELYTQLCGGESITLVKPIIFEVPQREIELFERQRGRFAEWQIVYNIKRRSSGTGSPKQIIVSALPSLVAERCRLDPKLLIDVLRREVHHPLYPSAPLFSSNEWIHRITHCPAGLVDMVNSRACRSAVMFNDVLDREQCKELVRSLARCVLPFQCAHGRVSCVILPGWESRKEEAEGGGKGRRGFVEAWKRWQGL